MIAHVPRSDCYTRINKYNTRCDSCKVHKTTVFTHYCGVNQHQQMLMQLPTIVCLATNQARSVCTAAAGSTAAAGLWQQAHQATATVDHS